MAEKKPLCIYSGKLKELQSGDTVPDTAHASLTNNPHSVTASQAGAIPEAASSTDNAIARWHETDGDELQNSGITISDTDVVSGITGLLPAANNTYNIGDGSGYYNNLYVHAIRGNYGGSSNTVGCIGQFVPNADGTRYLGSSSLQWLQVYLSDRVNANGSSPMYAPNVATGSSGSYAMWHGDYLRKYGSISSLRYKTDVAKVDKSPFDPDLLSLYNFKYIENYCSKMVDETDVYTARKKDAKAHDKKTDNELKQELISAERDKIRIGLIAENLAQVHPNLVNYDAEGKPESINDFFVPPFTLSLVGELMKKIKTQQATIDSLMARLEKLENRRK